MTTIDPHRENRIENLLDDLTKISEELQYHQQTAEGLGAQRDHLIRQAREAGAKINPIIHATGVNRSRIYQILDRT